MPFYLIAQSHPSNEVKILDACEKKEEVLRLIACYLKATKGTLVNSIAEMQAEGVHVIEAEEQKEYHIFKTINNGYIRNTFWSDHVLTYRVVEYNPSALKVALPQVKGLKDVLQAGKADFDAECFF